MNFQHLSKAGGDFRLAVAALLILALVPACEKKGPSSDRDSGAVSAQDAPSSTSLAMVLIPGGEFRMGSEIDVDTQPLRSVRISPFSMSALEISQSLYEEVMGLNPARWKNADSPVERVRWREAVKFCNLLSQREGLQPCYDLTTGACDFEATGYRLPTEAEWEIACRGGTDGDYYFGSESKARDYEWFNRNGAGRSHPSGQKKANPFGLFDMGGNVREWCNDWYQVDYYDSLSADSPTDNPRGPSAGEKKVIRGGAFSTSVENCSSWKRYCDDPGFTDACVVSDDTGFRVVRRAK